MVKAGRRVAAIEVKSGRDRKMPAGMDAFLQSFQSHGTLLVGGDSIPIGEFLSRPVSDWVGA